MSKKKKEVDEGAGSSIKEHVDELTEGLPSTSNGINKKLIYPPAFIFLLIFLAMDVMAEKEWLQRIHPLNDKKIGWFGRDKGNISSPVSLKGSFSYASELAGIVGEDLTFSHAIPEYLAGRFLTKKGPARAKTTFISGSGRTRCDFDGDGKTDIARWRAAGGEWSIINSSNNAQWAYTLPGQNHIAVPEDYDGDGKTDVATFRESTGAWTVRRSSDGVTSTFQLGKGGDHPVPADYDGDNKADVAVWRPSDGNWHIRRSSDGVTTAQAFGVKGDVPVLGDYDGDGRSDLAVFRPGAGTWYVLKSSNGTMLYHVWGLSQDVPVPADYDGDGRTDCAVYRPSNNTWYALKSSASDGSYLARVWGNYGDQPTPADYDGDGKADFTVWRPTDGGWHIAQTSDESYSHRQLGANSDLPVPSAYLKKVGAAVATNEVARSRLSPRNRTGSTDLYSQNFSWSTGLIALPGRAGLDMNLSLSYNSLVWTKAGAAVYFNSDMSNISPGFRFGFPVIEPGYYDADTGRFSHLIVSPSGARTVLRQVGASNIYEASDSSYLQLEVSDAQLTLRATNGTQIKYTWQAGAYRCAEVKDRNGNFLTISHDEWGLLRSVTDTLGRIVTVNYDPQFYPISITQTWEGNVTHIWARFAYANIPIKTNFTGLRVIGAPNGGTLKVLSQVTFADGSSNQFDYTSWGQVWRIRHHAADGHLLNYVAYNLPQTEAVAQTDCPRFTERRDWAENFNLVNNQPAEVVTQYQVQEGQVFTIPGSPQQSGTLSQVTQPDGTVHRVYSHSTGWDESLPLLAETWANENGSLVRKRWSSSIWTQDDTSVAYLLNPRITEERVGDEGSVRRTTLSYHMQPGGGNASRYGLVKDFVEYDSDGTTQLRRTQTEYNLASTYTARRIIGLVRERSIYDKNNALAAKITYAYDQEDFAQPGQNITPVQHDSVNFGASFILGRGNLTSTTRHDVTGQTAAVTSRNRYNTAGSVVSMSDPRAHEVKISYDDSFSDGNNSRSTFAYPTVITDPDNYSASSQYRYDIGAVVRTTDPKGATVEHTYDAAGRPLRVTNLVNNSYKRWVYQSSGTIVETFATLTEGAGEAYSASFLDGVGRERATIALHPGSNTGSYSATRIEYDVMGRVKRQSVPTEIDGSWRPTGDDTASGWRWKSQTYDWKGRVLITANTDGTTQQVSYEGCGCAGGEIITLSGEVLEGGVQRRQKIYHDILGRAVKKETLDYQGNIYSTTTTVFNALDQATSIKQYQGRAASGGSCPTGQCQETTMTFDGHGRLWQRHDPRQDQGTFTTYVYNADDTLLSATDARGATKTYSYNNRHLVTGISYSAPAGIQDTPDATFAYDSVGNRTSMTDGLGSQSYEYDTLSRLISETRNFNGVGSYTLDYAYTLSGAVKAINDPQDPSRNVTYSYDRMGHLTSIGGNGFGGIWQYASNVQYRAWGAIKHLEYGNGLKLDVGYNNRLQASSYNTPTVLSKTYDYNADGSLRFSHDLLQPKFDRAYKYDHAGRVVEALSGEEARNPSVVTNDRPYRETFGYDVWGHLTTRATKVWAAFGAQLFFPNPQSYVNDRNTNWRYDADGRLTQSSGDSVSYTYDAAGQAVTVKADRSEITQGYDGDGQRVKTINAMTLFQGTTPSTSTTTMYYLRSSVLGGQVVKEINEQGQRRQGYVYAGKSLLAWQDSSAGPAHVMWEHRDAGGASVRRTNLNRVVSAQRSAELDPLGTNVELQNPPMDRRRRLPGEEMGGAITRTGFGDLFASGSTQCFIDGIEGPCDMAQRMLNSGAGVIAPAERVAPIYSMSLKRFVGFAQWNPAQAEAGISVIGLGAGWSPMGLNFSGRGGFSLSHEVAGAAGLSFVTMERALETGLASQVPASQQQAATARTIAQLLEAFPDDVRRAATALRERPSCRNLFASYIDPDQVLWELYLGINGDTFDFVDLGGSNGTTITAAENLFKHASSLKLTGRNDQTYRRSIQAGANIRINTNPAAPFRNGFNDYLRVNASDEIYRAMILIHELGHYARRIFRNDNASQIELDTNVPDAGKINKANTQRVYDNCFR